VKPGAAVIQSPRFSQQPDKKEEPDVESEQVHLALVKIKNPQALDDSTIEGIGRTLSQLSKLGLRSVVVVDTGDVPSENASPGENKRWQRDCIRQADRVQAGIEHHKGARARRLEGIIGVSPSTSTASSDSKARSVHIAFSKLLTAPLKRGLVCVIPPVGYTTIAQTAVSVSADDVILALTREFAGIPSSFDADEEAEILAAKIDSMRRQFSIDRLIILDSHGGIPSPERPFGAHVFLNLEQEFDDIQTELLNQRVGATPLASVTNLSSKRVKSRYQTESPKRESLRVGDDAVYPGHLSNLYLLRDVLQLLPPTTSAIVTTPELAADSSRGAEQQHAGPIVGTRRQKNPLIHNLLTDKPLYSSSLPLGRLGSSQESHNGGAATTFVKRGMPLTLIPDPRETRWIAPTSDSNTLNLDDPRIDLARLIYLIEDSFNRKLDVEDYLHRVKDRLAGLIIAGEYEGGAILTWETPPGVKDDGSEESRRRMVPYLDKFAVLKRSQGAGGVADVVFKAMTRSCFPHGVCWRSRQNNPVNKWYFERAQGTWRLPETTWTMFWTTDETDISEQTFKDYEGVCRTVVPSWSDKKAAAD
jgi:amino-acid N-acetyltransferase